MWRLEEPEEEELCWDKDNNGKCDFIEKGLPKRCCIDRDGDGECDTDDKNCDKFPDNPFL